MSRAIPPLDWPSIGRLLVVMPSWVGDATMATPLLASIRADANLRHVRVVGYMRAGIDELLDGCGLFDEMVVGRPTGWTGPWSEGRRLARRECDAAILLPNSWRLAATVRLAGIPIRAGYDREARGWMLTHPLPSPAPGGWKQPIPAIDYYLALAEALGIAPGERRMRLCASSVQQTAGMHILEQAGVAEDEPFVLLNPGASKAEKRWPAERFAALADHLCSRGLKVLVNGSPGEKEIVESVRRAAEAQPVDLTRHGVTLGSLKAIAPRARLLVTNDTGTRHIAAATATALAGADAPTLAILSLFGPTDPRWAQIEYQREKQISTGGAPMVEIAPELVSRACDELLDAPQ